MMNAFLILLFSCSISLGFAQDFENKTDFLDQITAKDISHLWTAERIQIEEDTITIERPQPFGFIGDNYQRFFIHFNSVIKNPTKTNEYFIYGKTKVKNNICEFQGTIILEEAYTYDFPEISALKQGFVGGSYEFYENPNEKGSGILSGKFSTDFFIDEHENILYNALMLMSDGYENNQFEGTWTSYSSGKTKKCNWGDFRIPDSGDLDIGAGEFSPAEEYGEMGWNNYRLAYFSYDRDEQGEKAYQAEKAKWWMN